MLAVIAALRASDVTQCGSPHNMRCMLACRAASWQAAGNRPRCFPNVVSLHDTCSCSHCCRAVAGSRLPGLLLWLLFGVAGQAQDDEDRDEPVSVRRWGGVMAWSR